MANLKPALDYMFTFEGREYKARYLQPGAAETKTTGEPSTEPVILYGPDLDPDEPHRIRVLCKYKDQGWLWGGKSPNKVGQAAIKACPLKVG